MYGETSRWSSLVGLMIAIVAVALAFGVGRWTSSTRAITDVVDVETAEVAMERCHQVAQELAGMDDLVLTPTTFEYSIDLVGPVQTDGLVRGDDVAAGDLRVYSTYQVIGLTSNAAGDDGWYFCDYSWVGTTPVIGDPSDARLGSICDSNCLLKPDRVRLSIGADRGPPWVPEDADGQTTFYCSDRHAEARCPYVEAFGV